MTDLALFRTYESHERGSSGYPFVWKVVPCPRDTDGDGDCGNQSCRWCGGDGSRLRGVKDIVREEAGHRCVRCGHPFVVGKSSVYEEGDDLHPKRTKRDAGVRQEVADLTFEGVVADGEVVLDPKGARRTNWSPCDSYCTHQGPFRFRYGDGPWTRIPEPPAGELVLGPEGYLHLVNGAEVQAAWRILTVHHLNSRKEDLRWHNLVALCQRCHLIIQRKVRMEQMWVGEHSPWFRPYAAAYYASSYLGVELTREETMDRLDELLALERQV